MHLQSQAHSNPARPSTRQASPLSRLLMPVCALLIAYGAVGVAVNLRLVSLLVEGFAGWLGQRAAWDAPIRVGLLAPLEGHYDARPWLAWAAWLAGVLLLYFRPARSPGAGTTHQDEGSVGRKTGRLPLGALIALAVLLLLGGVGRMVELWPQTYGISRFPYDDEGVYAGTSQLFLQGILPYRDYFFAHPPVAAIAYAPAMAYHFTEWGSPTSFMIARYLSVFYSLVTLALLFGIGYRLAGLWGGSVSGALWALDGRVVEINRKIMLEGPLVLLSCGAVLLYLWARPVSGWRGGRVGHTLLVMAGALAALSALTKIAGLACLLAILADMVWLRLESRRRPPEDFATHGVHPQLQRSAGRPFLALLLGAVVAALAVVGPFLLAAPQQFIREVFFFQFLRPSDGVVESAARVGDLTASLANALTPLMAALGFVALSGWVWAAARAQQGQGLGPWRVAVLWAFFSLILFTYSRSFYQHYYIQLAAPLCLLGAGTTLIPRLVESYARRGDVARPAASVGVSARLSPLALLILFALPLALLQWGGMTTRACPHCEDRIFEIVGRYVNNAVPAGAPVLSTDEQFNILAARPPSRTSTGYLVDSYGHMIYLGLNLDTRDWGDLASAALRGEHGNDPYAVMQSSRPQADFLERAAASALIVVHERGLARLADSSVETLRSTYQAEVEEARYTIYRR